MLILVYASGVVSRSTAGAYQRQVSIFWYLELSAIQIIAYSIEVAAAKKEYGMRAEK